MPIKLPIPGPKLREEAIRAAEARHAQLPECADRKWWAATVENLKEFDQEQKEKGR